MTGVSFALREDVVVIVRLLAVVADPVIDQVFTKLGLTHVRAIVVRASVLAKVRRASGARACYGRWDSRRNRLRRAASGVHGRDGDHCSGNSRVARRLFERCREVERCRIPAHRIVVHGARKHGAYGGRMSAGVFTREGPNLVTGAGRTPAGQQLVSDCAQREHVGARIPCLPGDPLGGTIRPADRRADAHALECFDHAEAARPRIVGGHEYVAQVERAMPDSGGARKVNCAGELRQKWQRLVERSRRVVTNGDIERLRGDVLFRSVRERPLDSCGDRLDDGGVKETGVGGARQLVGKRLCLLGSDIEAENLDGDQAIPYRLVGAEDGSESANTDLMQDPERAERWGRSERSRIVSGHSAADEKKCNTDRVILVSAGCTALRGHLAGSTSKDGSPDPFGRSWRRRDGSLLDMIRRPLREYEAVSPEPVPSMASASAAAADAPGGASPAGIDVRRLGWMRPLVGEYAFNYENVDPLYAGDPSSPDAWRAAIARVRAHPRNVAAIAAVIDAQQERRGAPPAAREAARRLADPATLAVVTGQQAGAFGGPLFTLLKAVTAIQLARRASAEHAIPIVPVFWVDAEDHDWEEVRNCTVLDADFQPRTIALSPPDGAGGLPVAALKLDERIEQSIEELAAALAQTEFTAWLIDELRAAYRPGVGMAAAFATWMESVLGPHGLVVFESADPAAKGLAAPVFSRELQSPGRTAALAASAGDELARRGHQPQVVPQPDSISLFHIDGVRRAIRRQDGESLIGDSPVTMSALLEQAARDPARFSPNVLLRPIVQDTLFPTICYVPGPSELAYLGQLRQVYAHFGVPMPLLHPRASATLIDTAAARFISRYALRIDDLQPRDESALNRLLQSQLPPEVERAIQEAGEAIRTAMQRVVEALPALDPTLAGAARTTLGRMEHDLQSLQSKVIQAAKRRDETLRRQFTRAQAQVFPLGQPQERTLSVAFFLNRYGTALVDRLLDELPLELGRHWVITI